MSDFLTKESRSMLMSRVRNRGTSAEWYVRKAVWSSGFRYRLNVRNYRERQIWYSAATILPCWCKAVFGTGMAAARDSFVRLPTRNSGIVS